MAISGDVAASFRDRPYPGGLTYSGHLLGCAAAIGAIEALEDEDLVARARRLGDEVLAPRLAALAARHPSVGEVRGVGCFWAVELVRDRRTREPLVPYAAAGAAARPVDEVREACLARGVHPFFNGNRLHVCPPLVVDEADLLAGLDAIDEALLVADAWAVGAP